MHRCSPSRRSLTAAACLATGSIASAQCDQWSDQLATGLDLFAFEIEVVDDGSGPELYAGGDFLFIGNTPARSIAHWNGTTWEPMGQLPDRGGHAIAGFDDGGGFRVWVGTHDCISNQYSGFVYSWNGSSWDQEGDPAGYVWAMEVFDDGSGPALYVGGRFQSIDGVSGSNVMRRVGSSWQPVGGGLNGDVNDLQIWDDGSGPKLYAAVDNNAAWSTVSSWDGTAWTTLPGQFQGQLAFNANTNRLEDLVVHDDGSGPALYACGSYASVTVGDAVGVARWNGAAWSALGTAPDASVNSLASYDPGDGRGPLLIAGGSFKNIGGVGAMRIAAWDGSSWAPLQAGGTSSLVDDLAVFDDGSGWPELWAVGRFQKAGGMLSEHVARLENPCAGEGTSYCTAGTTFNGCTALVSSAGTASRSAASGFDVNVSGSEGGGPGLIYFGTSGQQALPWGNGTSVRCVAPPLTRTGLDMGSGTPGLCDGSFLLDFNAWMAANPAKAPQGGGSVSLQCWLRDPQNTSNQGTSLSDGLRFVVLP